MQKLRQHPGGNSRDASAAVIVGYPSWRAFLLRVRGVARSFPPTKLYTAHSRNTAPHVSRPREGVHSRETAPAWPNGSFLNCASPVRWCSWRPANEVLRARAAELRHRDG